MGIPLLVRNELVGVLCIESEDPYRFHEEDKVSIELLGNYLAIAIQNAQLQERAEAAADENTAAAATAVVTAAPPTVVRGRSRREVK